MADVIDRAQHRVEEDLQRNINNVRAKTHGASREFCIDCLAPIAPARRLVIPGVQCCVTCQEIAELKNKHYTRGAI